MPLQHNPPFTVSTGRLKSLRQSVTRTTPARWPPDLLHPRVVAWREASGGRSDELFEGRVPSGEEGGCEELPLRGEAVAVSLRDLVDEPVGAEQAELSGDLGGEPAGLAGRSWARGRAKEAAQIAVAEAGRGPLATAGGLQGGEGGRVADAEGAGPAAAGGG